MRDGMGLHSEKGRVLMFASREICYLSANFFAHQLGAAFEELGYAADVCEFTAKDDPDGILAPYLGVHYEVIADFNSLLPRMVCEDGTPYLDRLDGPFFDFILDHPLFHYTGLSSGVTNLHALFLDEAQADYAARYYPKLASASVLPLGATRALRLSGAADLPGAADSAGAAGLPGSGGKDAECRIFFPATYDDPDEVCKVIQAAPDPLRRIMKALLEMRVADPLLPMEEAFSQYLKDADMELSTEQFALFMNAMYAVDAYIRNYFRKQAVDRLLAQGIPVTVAGSGWEKYRHPKERYLVREPEMIFGLSFERIARAHVLLNVSPMFNRGMHDRIPAGMANGAVVLTDENPYLKRHFADGEELMFYSLTDPDSLPAAAERLITDSAFREEIAARASLEFEAHHTWRCRAESILEMAGGR